MRTVDAVISQLPLDGSVKQSYQATLLLDNRGELVAIVAEGQEGENVTLKREVKARQLTVSNGMTGYAVCSACKSAIDPWDLYCRHCGAQIENPWSGE